MSRGQTLRALVNERLAAAAEDIFVLFEKTIAEYEEELCRSKEENQREPQLQDKLMSPRIEQVQGNVPNVQIPSTSPGPSLNQEITETPLFKEEPEEENNKQEEEQLPVSFPEYSAVCVKTEESSLLQQRQTEETQGKDISSEPHFHSETEGHTEHSSDTNNNHWESFSCSAPQMETDTDGDHDSQDQIRDRSTTNMSAPETTVSIGHMSGSDGKKHQCPICNKIFVTKQILQRHNQVHTGEKPFSCLICEKRFTVKGHLNLHMRSHTGEKPHRCSFCDKAFAQKCVLNSHVRTHTGEKPYSCFTCQKTFSQKCNLDAHMRTHTGEKPFSCSVCNKAFSQNSHLKSHMIKSHGGQSI